MKFTVGWELSVDVWISVDGRFVFCMYDNYFQAEKKTVGGSWRGSVMFTLTVVTLDQNVASCTEFNLLS